ncbi:MAG: GNAT family N-acetyltransferase [Pyrinomonadaceae bacterium]|nr:GNAT family N-acetyltransferase [Pyrinomonadaceae bacterium]
MEEKLKIRQAKIEELETLLEFEQGIVTAERPINPTLKDGEIHYYDLAELVRSDLSAVFVAELNNELIASGYVLEKEAKDYEKHDKYAYLGFMYVKPEHRGKGINQRILESLINWAKERGLNEIRLKVYSENFSAVKAYEKAGFKPLLLEMRMEEVE